MILVLDTSALWHRPLVETLISARDGGLHERGEVRALLPAVAFAERFRQLRRDGRDVETWLRRLEDAGIAVEPFGPVEARRLPKVEERLWARHARDYLVAAHLDEGRIAVTADEGPHWSGVVRWHPAQAQRAVASLLPEGEGSP